MLSDIEIAHNTELKHINEIIKKVDIDPKYVEYYGNYKAKIDYKLIKDLKDKEDGKLILVTAINPTSAGEGKTTTTISLADGLSRIGKKTVIALREPSLGPVFGVKGGATGGGYAQVGPMEDINLHFTGDFHAIGAANNLLAAMIDNHIKQGNSLNINLENVVWKRAVDMNDRQLRHITSGQGGKADGVERPDGFLITVASEIMAILCLSENITDLKERLGKIIAAYSYDNKPITAADLKATGSMAALLKDAIKPNLVQTLEGTPALIHGGPFANIAHGCNSVNATKLALKLGDYAVTEAGFGADLGAEKFFDIKCRKAGLNPSGVVLVATVRALKLNGGVSKEELNNENLVALKEGAVNLKRHIENIKNVFNMPLVVAINRFYSDSEAELNFVKEYCQSLNTKAVICEGFAKGSEGAVELAKEVVKMTENQSELHFSYDLNQPLEDKILAVVKNVYHGDGVQFTDKALAQLETVKQLGFDNLPVCMAKTQYSFSDDAKKLGAPEGFTVTVKTVRVSAGAGFVVCETGNIMTMPGLPKAPAAEAIDIDEDGVITGMF